MRKCYELCVVAILIENTLWYMVDSSTHGNVGQTSQAQISMLTAQGMDMGM